LIVHPTNWRTIGKSTTLKELDNLLFSIIKEIRCKNLSFSGGLDSSLILWYMVKIFGSNNIHCYTIASCYEHPDYIYANKMGRYFNVDVECYIPYEQPTTPDDIVKSYYANLIRQGVKNIITCDGIDEYMCGYYEHQRNLTEATYYSFLRNLYNNHLEPLNRNSMGVKVFLPYLDKELVFLMSQIPLSMKVNKEHRKVIMRKLAKGKIPDEIINRWKYGFCDAMRIKGGVK